VIDIIKEVRTEVHNSWNTVEALKKKKGGDFAVKTKTQEMCFIFLHILFVTEQVVAILSFSVPFTAGYLTDSMRAELSLIGSISPSPFPSRVMSHKSLGYSPRSCCSMLHIMNFMERQQEYILQGRLMQYWSK